MSTAVATIQPRPKSVLLDMANRFGMEPEAFRRTLLATVMPSPNVSNEQFAAFLLVAKQYDLNPLTKEIYAFPSRGGGVQPIVSIDGWMKLMNRHEQFDGLEFEDHVEDGKLTAVTARIYRKDRRRPITVTEYMSECRRDTDTWKKWPARMLRHKAAIQAARYAFGFSGIMDEDEAERMATAQAATVGHAEAAHMSKLERFEAAAEPETVGEMVDQMPAVESAAEVEEPPAEPEGDYVAPQPEIDPETGEIAEGKPEEPSDDLKDLHRQLMAGLRNEYGDAAVKEYLEVNARDVDALKRGAPALYAELIAEANARSKRRK